EVSAIANLFLAGEETAHAWASVLFGDRAPEGKLPIGMPASKTDQILLGKKDSVPYTEVRGSVRGGKWLEVRGLLALLSVLGSCPASGRPPAAAPRRGSAPGLPRAGAGEARAVAREAPGGGATAT
ncbi:unnamed protein product, partial [Prorocentrum cordatum]